MTTHGTGYYLLIKYFIENLLNGVFPLWDPYSNWGRPDLLDQRIIGEFNPFLWIYPIFVKLGFPRLTAFFLYTFIYFQIGVFGFHLLLKNIFKNKYLALIGSISLMFSSASFYIFNVYGALLVFIPSIWLIYFIGRFNNRADIKSFMGMFFCLGIILTTYMPFYFLTSMIPIIFLGLVFQLKTVLIFIDSFKRFLLRNKFLSVFCFLFLLLSCAPGIEWLTQSSRGETIATWRQGEGTTGKAEVLSNVPASDISSVLNWQGIVPDNDGLRHAIFFLPVILYLIIFSMMLNKATFKTLAMVSTILWLIFMFLGDLTPVHPFLFRHIAIFKYFRNLSYFLIFILPFVIILSLEQLRLFLENSKKEKNKLFNFLSLIVVYSILLIFFINIRPISPTYIVLIGSFILFSLAIFTPAVSDKNLYWFCFVFILLIQPVSVFYGCVKLMEKSSDFKWALSEKFTPRFSYIRSSRQNEDFLKGKNPSHGVQETSGFELWRPERSRGATQLMTHIDHDILEDYSKHKFVIYDEVECLPSKDIDFQRIQANFSQRKGPALLSGEHPICMDNKSENYQRADYITQASDNLKVLEFDLNSILIKSNFKSEKFLVYNDNFNHDWMATLNNKPVQIYLSNLSFKGVWLPAGENVLKFKYSSTTTIFIKYFTLISFWIFLIGTMSFFQIKNPRYE